MRVEHSNHFTIRTLQIFLNLELQKLRILDESRNDFLEDDDEKKLLY
jgi:hypothetical protein